MGSRLVYRTTNAPRAAVEGMNIHHRCLDVTVEPGRSSPISRFREVAEAADHCARRATIASSWERLTFSLEGRLDGLPLRASNEGLPRPRVARAQEANRPPSHSSFDRGTSSWL